MNTPKIHTLTESLGNPETISTHYRFHVLFLCMTNDLALETSERPGQRLARGVSRMLLDEGLVPLLEFPTKSGRRMDICALGPGGEIWCVEVKSSRADYQSDSKWQEYLDWCDRLFFAVPDGFPEEILPADQGLIRTDEYDAEIIRPAPEEKLASARRKAVTLRFARLAADRLSRVL